MHDVVPFPCGVFFALTNDLSCGTSSGKPQQINCGVPVAVIPTSYSFTKKSAGPE